MRMSFLSTPQDPWKASETGGSESVDNDDDGADGKVDVGVHDDGTDDDDTLTRAMAPMMLMMVLMMILMMMAARRVVRSPEKQIRTEQ